MADYSQTPLPVKLGIKPESRVVLVGAPPGFEAQLDPLPPGAVVRRAGGQARRPCDVVVAFFTRRAEFERGLEPLTEAIRPAGALWVAWPKKASGRPTDMTDHVIREVALPTGLVDNKICAVDEIWTGMRLVVRKELR